MLNDNNYTSVISEYRNNLVTEFQWTEILHRIVLVLHAVFPGWDPSQP